MRVDGIRALGGPNVYSHRPVLSMRLYLDALAGKESREFPGFDEVWDIYRTLFTSMGVKSVKRLCMDHRDESSEDPRLEVLADATAVFFTGGDQLRITTRLGGTALSERIEEIYKRGGILAGTSAGATAIGEMMLVGSPSEGICKLRDINMTPGLGLVKNVIIDQHFSERGRIRRLLGAVAENPRMLGIGIDEDTAVVIEGDGTFRAIGSGAVYVVDGHDLSYLHDHNDQWERHSIDRSINRNALAR